jgi:signal transduction histidine kinase
VALDLLDTENPPTPYLSEITADLAEIERFSEDILTTARLALSPKQGSLSLPLRLQPTDARQVLSSAVSRFGVNHPERNLLVDIAEKMPMIEGDPVMMRRVIDNLLENAHKYSSPEQSIELRAYSATGSEQGSCIEILIRDHGIGIASSELPHVFTPFFRSIRSQTRTTGGVGLGLLLARRIAQAHGGDIDLNSEADVGTTAKVRLPIP